MTTGEYDGRVTDALPNDLFRIDLDGSQEIFAHLSSELRAGIVRILPGDRVRVKVSMVDPTRGRIIRRY